MYIHVLPFGMHCYQYTDSWEEMSFNERHASKFGTRVTACKQDLARVLLLVNETWFVLIRNQHCLSPDLRQFSPVQ